MLSIYVFSYRHIYNVYTTHIYNVYTTHILHKFTPYKHADIDECMESLDNCHDDSNCTDTEGGFACNCNKGFLGDGIVCSGK